MGQTASLDVRAYKNFSFGVSFFWGQAAQFQQDLSSARTSCRKISPQLFHAGRSEAPQRGWQHYQHWFGRQPHYTSRQFGLPGTKGAVDAITGVLSRELGSRTIRVNALNPGMVETEGTHSGGFIGSEFETGTIAQTPLLRVGQAGEIASIAVFLASDDSAWLTGEQILTRWVAEYYEFMFHMFHGFS